MTQLDSRRVDAPDTTAYRERLRQLLPELRQIEGFPIGSDEDILALSDPPYYTACPNPFLDEFIATHGTPYDEATDDYHREPFAADVSEGKNDPIYNAHSYHTKVPHKAIMRYILHYTKPGDIVFDGFAGSGMTGVAAQLCGDPDPEFRLKVENEWRAAGHPPPEWGARKAILCDLSPAATFIAYNYNTPVDVDEFEREALRILDEVEAEYGWMYETLHTDGVTKGRINYTVWSDVFLCPNCGREIVFWDAAVDEAATAVREKFVCGSCGVGLQRAGAELAMQVFSDPITNELRRRPAMVPVLIDYTMRARRVHRPTTMTERAQIAAALDSIKVDRVVRPVPVGQEAQRNIDTGFSMAHHFYTSRNLAALEALHDRLPRRCWFPMQASIPLLTKLVRYNLGRRGNGPLSGTLYRPSLMAEANVFRVARGKVRDAATALRRIRPASSARTTTSSNTSVPAAESTVDYVFTDPPFGSNLEYSGLNFLWEDWLGVVTNSGPEAIVEQRAGKALVDYQRLMEGCFAENYRLLKSGRWMTVEFHNSRNSVWNSIQEAIQRAGFVVADVRVLDKQQGTFKQVGSAGAVKQDLVISAYKPKAGFEQRFRTEAGTESGAWDFVRQHLEQLPVFVEKVGLVEVVAERQNYLLYDRMIAFHIQRGATIPLSAASFYAGLKERFPERDGMYFTEVQAAEYDQRRAQTNEIEQLSIFVVDEKSAIQWLRAELADHPQTFQELQPKFLQELSQNRYEELPELRDLLEQNFLEDSTTHRWRVPDPAKQADLEALRNRALLVEFAEYLPGAGKLKRFRLEAIRAGVAALWSKRDYRAIIRLADRLPDEVVQEDPALLMYYDNAVTREGGA